MKINAHYRQLEESYLFSTIAQKSGGIPAGAPAGTADPHGDRGRDPASQPACD